MEVDTHVPVLLCIGSFLRHVIILTDLSAHLRSEKTTGKPSSQPEN